MLPLSLQIGLILYSVCVSLNAYHKHPALGEMPNYVRSIVLKKLGNLWTMGEDRRRIKRRLGALQNLSLMKNNIKNELENIKNDLSNSRQTLECDGKKILVEKCNGDCSNAHESEGKNVNFTYQNDAFRIEINLKLQRCTVADATIHLIGRSGRINASDWSMVP